MSHPVSVRIVITLPNGTELPCELGEADAEDQSTVAYLLSWAADELYKNARSLAS